MLEKIKNLNLFKCRSVAGVHISLLPDNKLDIDLTILKRKKTKLEIENTFSSLTSFEELFGNIPGSTPVCLNIDGKGIIHKKINVKDKNNDITILDQVLPNASLKDIWMQKTEIYEDLFYISVVRKEIINNIVTEFKTNGKYIVAFSLGPFILNNILGIINLSEKNIPVSDYEISIENNRIIDINKNTTNSSHQKHKIGDDELTSNMLIPFAAGFEYFIQTNIPPEEFDSISTSGEEFFYKKIFVTAGWSVLIFLFVLLLTNFLLFDKYNTEYNDLSYKISQNKDLLSRLDTLTKELELKEEFITKGGLLRSSRNSYYADRIAYMLPENIMLTKMDIQPLKKKIKESKEPEFLKNIIHVAGLTQKSTLLDEWIKKIRKEKWVDDINILNYLQDSDLKTGEFEIEIKIKSEECQP